MSDIAVWDLLINPLWKWLHIPCEPCEGCFDIVPRSRPLSWFYPALCTPSTLHLHPHPSPSSPICLLRFYFAYTISHVRHIRMGQQCNMTYVCFRKTQYGIQWSGRVGWGVGSSNGPMLWSCVGYMPEPLRHLRGLNWFIFSAKPLELTYKSRLVAWRTKWEKEVLL